MDAPTAVALEPFGAYAAALAATQDGAWAMGRTASDAALGLVTAWAQQAQLTLSWAEVAGKTLATLMDSRLVDELVQANVAFVRAQSQQALDVTTAMIVRIDGDRPSARPAPTDGPASAGVKPEAPLPAAPLEEDMRVSDCMTRDVQLADPNDTIAEAARCMARIDAGVLPVGSNGRLVGMITDRDIAIRAVAEGKGPDAKVSEAMNMDVKYCFDDQEVDDVLQSMGDLQVRRMPVLNRDKRLVGIVSLGDLAANSHARPAGEALTDISRPGGQHSQTAH
jgi:CBS domain-containing protein